MAIELEPIGDGTQWADLSFGQRYLTLKPSASGDATKGITTQQATDATDEAQNIMEPLFRRFYDKATLTGWTGSSVPPMVRDWATRLATAILHEMAAASSGKSADPHREWKKAIIQEIKDFLESGYLLLDPDGDEITRLETPAFAMSGIGPLSSGMGTEEVFGEDELERLVEYDSKDFDADYVTQDEATQYEP